MASEDQERGAAALTKTRSIVVISDWVEGDRHDEARPHAPDWTGDAAPWPSARTGTLVVAGGYLERLPLSLIARGAVEQAEIWHHWRGEDAAPFRRETAHLARRAFRIDDERPPYASGEMVAFVRRFGAPHILVVLGLGVAPALLEACANSIIVYNSIDAPSLRVPETVSRHFDLVITGAQWQSDEVHARHPGMATAILPIGPEFATAEQFRPLGIDKDLDLIYVAAAQPYKRHDILFAALAALPRDVRALCVFGYGEQGEALRREAATQALGIEFVGPPGVPFDEVNRLMNRARFGVVCGVDDGAPAILTEYMLAGLPVLANAALACGLQYITPQTGRTATAMGFADALMQMRRDYMTFSPRETALTQWTWPHSSEKLLTLVKPQCNIKRNQALATALASDEAVR